MLVYFWSFLTSAIQLYVFLKLMLKPLQFLLWMVKRKCVSLRKRQQAQPFPAAFEASR